MTSSMESMTPPSNSNAPETTSKTALGLNPMIQKDLDDEIDYYRRKKTDEALSVERRQRIQTAISLGELDACLYQGNRFQLSLIHI